MVPALPCSQILEPMACFRKAPVLRLCKTIVFFSGWSHDYGTFVLLVEDIVMDVLWWCSLDYGTFVFFSGWALPRPWNGLTVSGWSQP